MREDDRVTRLHENLLITRHASPATARCEDVIRDEVVAGRMDARDELLRFDREDGPRVRGLYHIEVGAVQSNGPQDVGEWIHATK